MKGSKSSSVIDIWLLAEVNTGSGGRSIQIFYLRKNTHTKL